MRAVLGMKFQEIVPQVEPVDGRRPRFLYDVMGKQVVEDTAGISWK